MIAVPATYEPFVLVAIPKRQCHCGRVKPIDEWCACVSAGELSARVSYMDNLTDGFDVRPPEHECLGGSL